MKFLNLPKELEKGCEIISKRIGADKLDVVINVIHSDNLETGFKNGEGYISYKEKHHFFRLLGLFVEHFKGEEFSVKETAHFDTLSVMLDVSNGTAPTLKSLNEFTEQIALMGYNQVLFYAEDMYEIKERPHFGYMRGRYSFDEMKAFDDYAYELGVEIVPCIQTLGHLAKYMRWDESADVRDTGRCLLADSEPTYEFIDLMIKNSSAPFRTKRIHIGMDETADLGRGAYLKKHGYTDPYEIFVRHLKRVAEICDKYELTPMMWSDMFFCFCAKNGGKYEKDTVVPQEVIDQIPENMQLVYWNYEDPEADGHMLDKYERIGRHTIFGGGVWTWCGLLPDNIYSRIMTEASLKTCKEKGVKEVMITVWIYHAAFYQNALLEMQRYAELTYNDDSSHLKERFEFCTGASYEAFLNMSNYHAMYNTGKDYDSLRYEERFYGSKFLWQDIMFGMYDSKLYEEPRSKFYAEMAELYKKEVAKNDKWKFVYQYCLSVFEFLSVKCEIAEKLKPAYDKGDKETLRMISEKLMPLAYEKADEIHNAFVTYREDYLKPFGIEGVEQMWGGMKSRFISAKRRIDGYLGGKFEVLEELEAARLTEEPSAWGLYWSELSKIETYIA